MKKLLMLASALVAVVSWGKTPDALPPLPDGAFTFAVVSDTQDYDGEGRHTKRGRKPGVGPTTNAKLDAIVDWLAANAGKENIRFVAQTGDLTDMNNDPQWKFASNALSRIDGRLPYAISPGNHDIGTRDKVKGDLSRFNRYFPPERFAGNPWYVENFLGNGCSCCLFEYGEDRFVVVTLPCDPPNAAVEWADKMLAKYADRKAIISTHRDLGIVKKNYQSVINDGMKALQKQGRQREDYDVDPRLLGRMQWSKCFGDEGNNGVQMWEKLYSRHANIFLVVSGDQGQIKACRVDEKGNAGNMVHCLMQDCGAGFIRLFRFIPSEKRIACYTISPGKNGAVVHSYHFWREDKYFNFDLPYPGVASEKSATKEEPKADKLTLLAPAEGSTVPLLKPEVIDYLRMDRSSRRKFFADEKCRKRMDSWGDKPLAVTLAWSGVEGVDRYSVSVVREEDAQEVFFCSTNVTSITVDNLEIGCGYRWSVTAANDKSASVTGRFVTDATAPRLIRVKGINNIRDFGGRIGLDGKRVRQGRIYRSAGLNSNANSYFKSEEVDKMLKNGNIVESVPEMSREAAMEILKQYKAGKKYDRKHLVKKWHRGADRLDDASRRYMRERLGIRTDIDLRTDRECYMMTGSPVGEDVRWVHVPSSSYGGMADKSAKCAFAKVFRVFLDDANYPIDFHCIAGADRTGSVAFILGALLGVEEDELSKDWELTALQQEKLDFGHKSRYDKLVAVFKKYPGDDINARVAEYVKSCGFSDDDIAKFRSLMLK